MKKFIKTVCTIVAMGFMTVPMVLGFLFGLIEDAFHAGLNNADRFTNWG